MIKPSESAALGSREADARMRLNYATTNPAKFQYLARCFEGTGVDLVQTPLDLPEPRSGDVVNVALYKATYAFAQLLGPVVVIDAGFYIPSLKGFPQTYVNFVLDTIGVEGILTLVLDKNRECEFRHCVAYLDSNLHRPVWFLGKYPGVLAYAPRGIMQSHLWSELGRVFLPQGETATLAEMDTHEFDNWYKLASEGNAPDREFREWLLLHSGANLTERLDSAAEGSVSH